MNLARPITSQEEWLKWRRNDVTASEVAALFGHHPFKTAADLYVDKVGLALGDDPSGPMTRGLRLEPVIAAEIQQRHPDWLITKSTDYLSCPVRRMGATIDYVITTPHGSGILECKTVGQSRYDNVWEDGVPEMYMILQGIQQMMLTGYDFCIIAPMVVGEWSALDIFEHRIERHAKAEWKIVEAVAAFWELVKDRRMPPFNYSRDTEAIARLYGKVNTPTVDLRTNNRILYLLEEYEEHHVDETCAAERKQEIANEIKILIGDSEKALVNGWKLTHKVVEKKAYSVPETTYRKLHVKRLKADG